MMVEFWEEFLMGLEDIKMSDNLRLNKKLIEFKGE